jgi:hypothetical protein
MAPEGFKLEIENIDGCNYYRDDSGRWYMYIVAMKFGTHVFESDVINSCKKSQNKKELLAKHFPMAYNASYCN